MSYSSLKIDFSLRKVFYFEKKSATAVNLRLQWMRTRNFQIDYTKLRQISSHISAPLLRLIYKKDIKSVHNLATDDYWPFMPFVEVKATISAQQIPDEASQVQGEEVVQTWQQI